MSYITYEKFLELFEKASFIVADDVTIKSFSISKKPNIESIRLVGENDRMEYAFTIDKDLNGLVKIKDSSIFPMDDEGDFVKITFYEKMIIQN